MQADVIPFFPPKFSTNSLPPPSESDSSVSDNVDVDDITLATCAIIHETTPPIHPSITVKINHLAAANALNTPARRLIPQITFEYEIALVTNKILKLELKETRNVLVARKERQKDKIMIVKGQHHITTKLMLRKLKHVEAETQNKADLGSRTTKRRSF